MTVITGTIKNAAGELSDGTFTVKANKIYGFNGAIIDGNEYTVDVVDGVFTTPDIAPGPVKLIVDCGNWRKTFEKVLPDQETVDFWDLVESTLIYEPEIVSTVVQARNDAQTARDDAQGILDQVEAGVVPDGVVSRSKLATAVRDDLDAKLNQSAVDARVTAVGNATYATAFPDTTITYNGDGSVATVTDNGITTTYTYNGDGTVHTDSRVVGGVTTTRTYTYDPTTGNLTGIEAA